MIKNFIYLIQEIFLILALWAIQLFKSSGIRLMGLLLTIIEMDRVFILYTLLLRITIKQISKLILQVFYFLFLHY